MIKFILIKRVLEKIKGIFKSKKNMSYKFPEVDVAELEKKINIKENATQDGQNNIPKPESQTFSVCENESIVACDALRENEVSKASNHLSSIKNNIINETAELGKKHFFINTLKGNIDKTLTEAVGKLSPENQSFQTEQKHVVNYKLEHKINREPHTLTPLNIFISLGVIAFLFYFEMELNTTLLAPAMRGGGMEGKAVASAVAILNVFVSFGAGYLFIKNIHHVSSIKRRLAQIGLFFYTIFIIYINGVMGAFRANAEAIKAVKKFGQSAAETGNEIVAEQGNALLWFIGTVEFDVYPLILTFVGITFAIASLWDGYLFDDRYPGYGKVGKKRDQSKKKIDEYLYALPTEVSQKFNLEGKKNSELRDLLISKNIPIWRKNINDLEETFENYKRFAGRIEFAIDHCCGEYRAINNQFRTAALPKYWLDESGKMKNKYYELRPERKDPEQVFPGYNSLYLKKNEIEKNLESYQNKITEESNQYQAEVNSYREEVNKKVDSIISKYEVNLNA